MQYKQDIKSLGSHVWLLLAGWFVFQFAFFGIWITVFNLYLVRLGYATRLIGTINAGALLIYALMCIPTGIIGSRFGSRRTMIGGLLICTLTRILLLAASPGMAASSGMWILAMYYLSAIGSSAYMVNINPEISSTTQPENRTLAFSMYSAVGGLGIFLGSLFGGIVPGIVARITNTALSDAMPFRTTLAIVPLLFLVSAFLVVLLRREPTPAKTIRDDAPEKVPRPWSLILSIALVWFVFQAAGGPMFSFYNIYMDRDMNASISFIGAVRAASSLVSIPLVLATPLLAKLVGRSRLIRLMMFGVSGGFLLLSIRNPWIAAAAYVVVNASYGLAGAAFMPFSQEAVGPRHRAIMSGFIAHATTLSWAIMTFGGGAIVDALSFRTLFLYTAALPLVSVFAYLILKIDKH